LAICKLYSSVTVKYLFLRALIHFSGVYGSAQPNVNCVNPLHHIQRFTRRLMHFYDHKISLGKLDNLNANGNT